MSAVPSEPDRVYLDNAATSFPKPGAVYDAIDAYNRESGVAVGRAGHRRSVAASAVVDECRHLAARMFSIREHRRVVFTFNGTDSLNLAIHGTLRPGDHVVTTVMEHNSVLRPLRHLRENGQIEVSYAKADSFGFVDPATVAAAIRPNTALVVLTHASNVTGTIQAVADVTQLAHDAGALLLLDAAQSAGHFPFSVADVPVDMLACPGHKGLLGSLGTGLLYVGPRAEDRLESQRQGGTGSESESDRQPAEMPDKFESGNLNTPGLFGLCEALRWIHGRSVESLRAHELELTGILLDRLAGGDAIQVLGPQSADRQVGVVSLRIGESDPHMLATILDENFGIEVRAGLHCAPLAHEAIGTRDRGGTVRLSLGPFTSPDDIQRVDVALQELASVMS